MLSMIGSDFDQGIVVDPATRQLRHDHITVDGIAFLAWIGVDRRRAIGFAADLKPIVVSDEGARHSFVPLQCATLDQSVILRLSGSSLTVRGSFGEKICFNREWPSLWQCHPVAEPDIPTDITHLMPSFRALSLINGTDDLVRLSHADSQPETTALVKAVLKFCPHEAIVQALPDVAWGKNYPSLFEALREHLIPQAYGLRAFHPHIDWGGPPEAASAGAHTYGSPRILYYPPATVRFGRYCSIAEDVTVILANHLMTGATTYPFKLEEFRWPSQLAQNSRDFVARDVVVGNDVWIGRGSTILCGTHVGDGVIIGADCVIRGTVPPYSVVVGNPGTVIRYRYEPKTIERFLKLRWWDWPDWKVDRHSARMLSADPIDFLDAAEEDSM